jgi:hypothetical protein
MSEYGRLTRFVAKYGLEGKARYFSHLLNSRKNIGEKLARELEAACGLEPGWMDRVHDPEQDAREQSAKQRRDGFVASAGEIFDRYTDLATALLKMCEAQKAPAVLPSPATAQMRQRRVAARAG